MATFEYTAKDNNTGKEVSAVVEADTEMQAAKLLTSQGLTPTKIEAQGTQSKVLKRSKKVKAKDKVLFSRQLSTLIGAGVPLTQSLRSVNEQTQNKTLSLIIGKVTADIEGGNSFSSALAKHPKVFNTIFVSLVEAGEASGTLDESLDRLATQQEKDAEIISKVRGAMIYPAIVLLVIGLVIIFMLTTVLPQVELLYKDLDRELPILTSIMLSMSQLVIRFWYVGVIVIGLTVYFLRQYVETTSGRQVFDTIKMRLPLFGMLFRKLYMARFARVGETLLRSGVPMLQMMGVASGSVNNVLVSQAIDRSSEKIKGGKALSESLAKEESTFLTLVPQMIKIGEDSGNIDSMMGKAATYYEGELDDQIKAISTIIEPALMVVLAIVAGALIGAILLPVYSLVGENIGL